MDTYLLEILFELALGEIDANSSVMLSASASGSKSMPMSSSIELSL